MMIKEPFFLIKKNERKTYYLFKYQKLLCTPRSGSQTIHGPTILSEHDRTTTGILSNLNFYNFSTHLN